MQATGRQPGLADVTSRSIVSVSQTTWPHGDMVHSKLRAPVSAVRQYCATLSHRTRSSTSVDSAAARGVHTQLARRATRPNKNEKRRHVARHVAFSM